MDFNILQYLPDNTKIKIDKKSPSPFPNIKLTDLSKSLNVRIKNISRYKNGSRSIPIRLFEKLICISNLNLLDFQNIINMKVGKTGVYLKIGPYIEINEDWVYISQLINGDGHIRPKFQYINFVNKDKNLLDYVYNFFVNKGLSKNHFTIIKRPEATFLTIRCSLLAILFNKIFKVSIGKKEEIEIPDFVVNNDVWGAAAVRGAFDSEGSVSVNKSKRISICSNSLVWITKLNQILKRLRIKAIIFKEEKNRNKPLYRLLIYHIINIKRFYEIIRPIQYKRNLRLKELAENFNRNPNEFFYKKILCCIENGICRRREISNSINKGVVFVNNNLCKLKKRGCIIPAEKVYTNKGCYFNYMLTPKGKEFLDKGSDSFFD